MNSLFHFSDSDGWSKIIKDQIDLISEQNIGCPLILLGHSLGSYMALNVLQQIEKLKTDVRVSGLVLSGSGYESKWLYRINKLIAKIEILDVEVEPLVIFFRSYHLSHSMIIFLQLGQRVIGYREMRIKSTNMSRILYAVVRLRPKLGLISCTE